VGLNSSEEVIPEELKKFLFESFLLTLLAYEGNLHLHEQPAKTNCRN
jgi:hypothetical protein